jgi:UDP-glucose 4-epimerase
MDKPQETSGEVYNIGNTDEVTINQLADQVIKRVGSSSEKRLVSYSEAYAPGFEDMRRRVPDISKLQTATGWTPKADLTEIIDDVIAWERAHAA